MKVPEVPAPRRRVGVALGGGGARGYAHIGVIDVLTEHGFDVAAVAGSSMGALVGGLYAAEQLETFTGWVRGIGQREIMRLLDPLVHEPGAIGAEKVMARVGELIGDARIEDLPIPFTAVSTDLLARRPFWFQRGPLLTAIRASIALPPAITPVVVQGRLLNDGGLMDPVPIGPIASAQVDTIIAVSMYGPRQDGSHATAREPFGVRTLPRPSALRPFGRSAHTSEAAGTASTGDDVSEGFTTVATREDLSDLGWQSEGLPPGLRKIDVVNLSMEAVAALLTRYQMAGFQPDLLIEVPVDACGTLEFHRGEEMIELGRSRAEQALARSGLGS